MNAMLLAAGRGQRMQNLTDNTPKPLLTVAHKALIDWQIESLVRAKIEKIIINLGYLGDKIQNHCGNGKRYSNITKIIYSVEKPQVLETGGGVFNALHLLGDEPFIITSADILTDFSYEYCLNIKPEFAHIFLIDNPDFKEQGDFSLLDNKAQIGNEYTYSNIGVMSPKLFSAQSKGRYPLAPILREHIKLNHITAEYIDTKADIFWMNLGTPEQLNIANELYNDKIQ